MPSDCYYCTYFSFLKIFATAIFEKDSASLQWSVNYEAPTPSSKHI